jgi:hypothetical protein
VDLSPCPLERGAYPLGLSTQLLDLFAFLIAASREERKPAVRRFDRMLLILNLALSGTQGLYADRPVSHDGPRLRSLRFDRLHALAAASRAA